MEGMHRRYVSHRKLPLPRQQLKSTDTMQNEWDRSKTEADDIVKGSSVYYYSSLRINKSFWKWIEANKRIVMKLRELSICT